MKKIVGNLIKSAKTNKDTHLTVLKIFGSVILFAVLMCVLIATFPKATALSMLGLVLALIFGLLYSVLFDTVRIHKRSKR